MIFGEIPNFGDFGGNPGVWFLVLPTNYVYTTLAADEEIHSKSAAALGIAANSLSFSYGLLYIISFSVFTLIFFSFSQSSLNP